MQDRSTQRRDAQAIVSFVRHTPIVSFPGIAESVAKGMLEDVRTGRSPVSAQLLSLSPSLISPMARRTPARGAVPFSTTALLFALALGLLIYAA